MIADQRAEAMVENFVGQWLQLRNLESRVKPDFLLFPDFDDNLRKAFRRETELLFANVLREGRPVHELVDANYTFVNERLARHYGIHGVYGARFRKVDVDDPNRYGSVRSRQLARVDFGCEPDVADHSRQVHHDGVLEQPAAAAAGRRAGARGERAERSAVDGSRAARAASRRTRPARLATTTSIRSVSRSRTSTSTAAGAMRRAKASTSTRRASCPMARRSTARSRCGAPAGRSRAFREHRHRKDADLCTRSRFGAGRHAGRPRKS